jgi:CheY-specific phosphatase CheX
MTNQLIFGDRELCEITELVLSTLLERHAVPVDPAPDALQRQALWTGCVAINGPFVGAVTVASTREFAHHATNTMVGELGDESARDVLAEITNVIGGNIKSLLSTAEATCVLSLPVVSVGALDLPFATLLVERYFRCDDDLVVVGLWRAEQPPNGRSR